MTTREEKIKLIYKIIKEEDISVLEIVSIKESAMKASLIEMTDMATSLACSASTIFHNKKMRDNMKVLTAKNLVKLGIFKGTKFEQELLVLINKE